MKTAFKIFMLLAVVGYIAFALWRFAGQAENRVCEGVSIEIFDDSIPTPKGFVTEAYIRSVLTQNNVSPEGMKLRDIDLGKVEQLMLEELHIERATCFFNTAGMLCIRVVPQYPVLHVISQKGEDYYLAANGLTMPIEGFNVELCVATGNVTKEFASEHLVELARFIHDDLFWKEQIEQIHVVSPDHIELYPRVGQHVIDLGSVENFREKFQRLRLFYREGLERVGWNKYQTISLAYDDQVVCTKAKANNKNK